MRVLITCGSKRGGTEGIGRMLADALQQEGHHVDLLPPDEAARATGFDAVIVGIAGRLATWATGELYLMWPQTEATGA